MAPPTPLAIATSSLQRLVKEEVSYEKELKGQEARLEKILASKDGDENAEYSLKQEVRGHSFGERKQEGGSPSSRHNGFGIWLRNSAQNYPAMRELCAWGCEARRVQAARSCLCFILSSTTVVRCLSLQLN